MASNVKSLPGRSPSRPVLITYPIPAEGIEWEVLQENIHSFLGPEAFARIHLNQDGIEQYLITAAEPFTKSQLNDLQAFSAEMIEYREEDYRSQRCCNLNTSQAQPRCNSGYNSLNSQGDNDRRSSQIERSLTQLRVNFQISQSQSITLATTSRSNSFISYHSSFEFTRTSERRCE